MKPLTVLVLSLLVIAAVRPAAAQDDPGIGPSVDAMTIQPDPPVYTQEAAPFYPVPFPYYRRPHTINFANPFLLSGHTPYDYQASSDDQADSADQTSSYDQGAETQPTQSFRFSSPRKRHRYHPAMRRAIEASRRQAKEADAIITGTKKSDSKNTEAKKADADGAPADTTPEKESAPRPTDEKP